MFVLRLAFALLLAAVIIGNDMYSGRLGTAIGTAIMLVLIFLALIPVARAKP